MCISLVIVTMLQYALHKCIDLGLGWKKGGWFYMEMIYISSTYNFILEKYDIMVAYKWTKTVLIEVKRGKVVGEMNHSMPHRMDMLY